MSSPHDAGIFAEGLGKRYGDLWALRDVDLDVPQGTVLGLLGHNGAGKTTAVRILTTLLRPTEGRASVAGHDVVADAATVRTKFGLAGQQATVDGLLTARANLEMVGRLYHLPRAVVRARADELLERLSLSDAADRLVRTFSGRHAPPPGPRRQPRRGTAGALPRRADHGAGSPQPHRAVEPAGRARPRRRHAAAHDAVPGGGRPPGRRHRRPRRRSRRRPGLAGRAQGAHRRRAPRGDRRRRRRARGRGRGARALRQRPARRSTPTPPASSRRSRPASRWPRSCARSTPPASPPPTCTAARRRSTTSSSPSPIPRRRPRRSPPDVRLRRAPALRAVRQPRRRAAQPVPHPPDPREAHRRHRPAADVRDPLRLRLRRGDRDPRRGRLPRVPDGRDLHPDADLRRHGSGHVDGDRPRRGDPRPLPLAADGALGLPDRARARRVRRRDAGADRDDARRPRRRLADPHRRVPRSSPASACWRSSPS